LLHRPVVASVLGHFLEVLPSHPVERLEEQEALDRASQEQPTGVTALQMSQLVSQDDLVVLG
jgi:hypothetical protein